VNARCRLEDKQTALGRADPASYRRDALARTVFSRSQFESYRLWSAGVRDVFWPAIIMSVVGNCGKRTISASLEKL
jgi:hypothetical protein